MNYNYPIFNPMYQNPMPQQMYQQPQFQPMQQSVPQPIQQQQSIPQQNISLPGKIVESFDVMKSMDIPMDGNTYYFPKADGTEVYSKRWLQNGSTEQIIYKAVKAEEATEQPNPLLDKLNGIEEQINKLEDMLSKQTKTTSKREN